MHELAIAQEIVAMVTARAPGAEILRVVLEVGKLAPVLPDALRFCFDVCAEGTSLHGATLDIREVPGRARCRTCGAEVPLEQPFGQCACGCTDLAWLTGEELRIKEIHARGAGRPSGAA
jgi:hydrogenase nickel incorporation protein HypA/HybF